MNIIPIPGFLRRSILAATTAATPIGGGTPPGPDQTRNPLPRFMSRSSQPPALTILPDPVPAPAPAATTAAGETPPRNGLREMEFFVGGSQAKALEQFSSPTAEEGEWYNARLCELADLLPQIPLTHATQDIPLADKKVWLHYFGPNYDAWIIERDIEGDDPDEPGQHQAFALGCFSGNKPTMGYVSLPEMFKANIELDLHFEPTSAREIMAQQGYPLPGPEPEPVKQVDPPPLRQPDLNLDLSPEEKTFAEPPKEPGQKVTLLPVHTSATEKQKEFLAMKDGWQPGAILYSQWGYDQTNIDFYVIVKRTKAMVEIKRVAADLVGGDPTWGGKVMPDPGTPYSVREGNPETSRHKLQYHGNDPAVPSGIKLTTYSYASLWQGEPKGITGYA